MRDLLIILAVGMVLFFSSTDKKEEYANIEIYAYSEDGKSRKINHDITIKDLNSETWKGFILKKLFREKLKADEIGIEIKIENESLKITRISIEKEKK